MKEVIQINNVALDIMMGLLCVALALTFLGIAIIPDVLEIWEEMRSA